MKFLKVFVLPVFLVASFGLQSFANSPTTTPVSKSSELRKELIALVDDIDLSSMKADSEKVMVQFVVNVRGELVVLDIDDSPISPQILSLLDRKDIKTEGVAINKLYLIPMVFNKK